MTQHLSQEQNLDDQETLRRLAKVIGAFMLGTAVLAILVVSIVG